MVRAGLILGLVLSFVTWTVLASGKFCSVPPPPPGSPDRLAIPTLPPDPGPFERGNLVYYYNCMPCHGDQRQGLTEEFRQVWVDDHQNCWARGCHGGRIDDEGFPIPRFVPGLADLSRFPTLEALQNYLTATHPPQRPGVLSPEEYRDVTFYLAYLEKAGPRVEIPTRSPDPNTALPVLALSFMLLATLYGVATLIRSQS